MITESLETVPEQLLTLGAQFMNFLKFIRNNVFITSHPLPEVIL